MSDPGVIAILPMKNPSRRAANGFRQSQQSTPEGLSPSLAAIQDVLRQRTIRFEEIERRLPVSVRQPVQ